MDLKPTTKLSWYRHLNSPEGIAGMLIMRELTPAVIGKGEASEIIFEAGITEGYRRALDVISKIIGEEPRKEIDYENK